MAFWTALLALNHQGSRLHSGREQSTRSGGIVFRSSEQRPKTKNKGTNGPCIARSWSRTCRLPAGSPNQPELQRHPRPDSGQKRRGRESVKSLRVGRQPVLALPRLHCGGEPPRGSLVKMGCLQEREEGGPYHRHACLALRC